MTITDPTAGLAITLKRAMKGKGSNQAKLLDFLWALLGESTFEAGTCHLDSAAVSWIANATDCDMSRLNHSLRASFSCLDREGIVLKSLVPSAKPALHYFVLRIDNHVLGVFYSCMEDFGIFAVTSYDPDFPDGAIWTVEDAVLGQCAARAWAEIRSEKLQRRLSRSAKPAATTKDRRI